MNQETYDKCFDENFTLPSIYTNVEDSYNMKPREYIFTHTEE